MTQEFLHGADIVAIFQNVRSEAVTEGVAAGVLGNTGITYRFLYGLLQEAFVLMVT